MNLWVWKKSGLKGSIISLRLGDGIVDRVCFIVNSLSQTWGQDGGQSSTLANISMLQPQQSWQRYRALVSKFDFKIF